MLQLQYLTDQNGQPNAVVVPISLWRKIVPQDNISIEALSDSMEDYWLNKAMDEAQNTPLLSRDEALAYLEAELE